MMIKHDGYLRVLKIIIPYFFVVGVFQIVGYGVAGLDLLEGEEATSIQQLAIVSFFGMIGTLLIVWLWSEKVDKDKDRNLYKFNLQEIRNGLVSGGIIILVGFLVLLVVGQLSIASYSLDWSVIGLGVLLFLFVSVAEEVIMRGYVLKNLMLSFNPWIALVVSSLLFSVMHFANPAFSWISFTNLFLAGMFLGLPFIFNQNLSFPVAGHFVWNYLQGSIFGFEVSGRQIESAIELNRSADSIWNGGDFGFEGSILCTVFLFISIIIVYKVYNSRATDGGK